MRAAEQLGKQPMPSGCYMNGKELGSVFRANVLSSSAGIVMSEQ